jgi:hypothetical protein
MLLMTLLQSSDCGSVPVNSLLDAQWLNNMDIRVDNRVEFPLRTRIAN